MCERMCTRLRAQMITSASQCSASEEVSQYTECNRERTQVQYVRMSHNAYARTFLYIQTLL